jgi:hypothetical protein
MPEYDETPYFEDTYTVYSVHPDYLRPFTTCGTAFPAPPPQGELSYVCPPASLSIMPPSAYDTQTLEASHHYPPRFMEPWMSSHSEIDEYCSLYGSSWRHPTTMDAPQTASLTSGYKHSTLNQPSASAFGVAYRSEAQKGTPLDFVDSFHSELGRLQQSNTSQTGSKSKPVPGSAEWANKLALQNATKIAVPMTKELTYTPYERFPPPEVTQHSSFTTDSWQYSERGEIKPDLGPEARVRNLPFQNTPVQYLEYASALPSESTAPQTALKGSTAEAFGYDGEMMAQAPPSAMVPSFTSTYGPPTVCHLDAPALETVYSSGTAAKWFAPTSGPPPIAITTPGPAHLVPAAASSGNVVDPTREKGGTRKPKGRPVISCDRCHRRKRKCLSSEGSESCDFCTQMRINGDTEACTWDLMRKYNDQT